MKRIADALKLVLVALSIVFILFPVHFIHFLSIITGRARKGRVRCEGRLY
jgi:hypothetical protein